MVDAPVNPVGELSVLTIRTVDPGETFGVRVKG
jgi:hypothetical protein